MTRRVLVVGGAGVFGSRLVSGILRTSLLDVVVAGRDRTRCEAAVEKQGEQFRSRLSVAVVDAERVTAAELREVGAFAVVDAGGPFGGRGPVLPRAAIAAGMYCLDLADDRAFVREIARLDGDARAAGVAVLSGASSTPALSNAVLDALCVGWQQVDRARITLSPAAGGRASQSCAPGAGPVQPAVA